MPFIRYDTGDLGSVSDGPCSCGRGLKRINEVFGRTRDFVMTPSGRQVHGAFFNHFAPFYETRWVGRWYVRQEAIDHITVTIYPVGPPSHADTERMRGLLTQALGDGIFVDIVIDSDPNVTPGGKQKVIESFVDIGNQEK
jgi:phenylacetate-CoA ligase